jgi:hypothetical protein
MSVYYINSGDGVHNEMVFSNLDDAKTCMAKVAEQYASSMRTIKIYSEKADNWVSIPPEQAIQSPGLPALISNDGREMHVGKVTFRIEEFEIYNPILHKGLYE